jgi:hypothetical protein
MPATIYTLRLSAAEYRAFSHSARAEGKKPSEWLRAAAHERTRCAKRRAACLDFTDKIELSAEAERNPKAFIEKQLAAKREHYGCPALKL